MSAGVALAIVRWGVARGVGGTRAPWAAALMRTTGNEKFETFRDSKRPGITAKQWGRRAICPVCPILR